MELVIPDEAKEKMLIYYPILLKEYNEDFTRKTPQELIVNMKGEISYILGLDFLSDQQKEKKAKDVKEMYYEIFNRTFRMILNTRLFDNMLEVASKEEICNLLQDMQIYFNKKLIHKITSIEDMYEAKLKLDNIRKNSERGKRLKEKSEERKLRIVQNDACRKAFIRDIYNYLTSEKEKELI